MPPKATTVRWHPHYDDPNGDLVLLSEDGLKFSTSGRLLGRVTDAFEEMEGIISTTLPNGDGDRKVKEIKLDIPSKTIIQFLDTISVSVPARLPSSFDECAALLFFADNFGCHELSTRITKHLHQLSVAGDKGQVFLVGPQLLMWASDKDDWALGRKALSTMNRSQVVGLLREDG